MGQGNLDTFNLDNFNNLTEVDLIDELLKLQIF